MLVKSSLGLYLCLASAAIATFAALSLHTQAVAAPPAAPLYAAPIPISSLPFEARMPGLYCVTGDLFGLAGADGISVSASGVTIDLGGHTITGADGALHAIDAAGISQLTVKNGTIGSWPGRGIRAGRLARISDVEIVNCGSGGIVATTGANLERCVGRDNAVGINAADFEVGSASTLRDCKIFNLQLTQGLSYWLGDHSRVDSCTATGGGVGMLADVSSIVTNCQFSNHSLVGIRALSRCAITDCRISFSTVGIEVEVGNDVLRNAVDDCTTVGIVANGRNNRIEDNSVRKCGTGIALPGLHNLAIGNYATQNAGGDFVTPVPNTVGAILGDFGTIQGNQPQANFKTPLF